MQVRTSGTTRAADQRDLVAGHDHLSDLDLHARCVGIAGDQTTAVIDLDAETEAESSLVETPETRPRRNRRAAPRDQDASVPPSAEEAAPQRAGEEASTTEPAPAPRRRAPRKPRAKSGDAGEQTAEQQGQPQNSAAE